MPRLLLLRHAKAVAQSAGGDIARELSKRGRRDAVRLGEFLRAQNIQPDAALVSPSKRTRETAELVLRELVGAPVVSFDANLYNASAAALLRAIVRTAGETLLVVAHNPGIGELAFSLAIKANAAAATKIGFPTCALAIFESDSHGLAPFSGALRLTTWMTPETMSDDNHEMNN